MALFSFLFKSHQKGLKTPVIMKLGVVIIMLIVLIAGGYYYKEKSKSNSALSSSSQPPKIQKIISGTAIFYSKIVPIMSKTTVTVTYQKPSKPAIIWLVLQASDINNGAAILIHHPIIDALDWPQVSNVSYTLWQKNPTYRSVEEFLKEPPKDKVIVADAPLVDKKIIATDKTELLSIDTSLDKADYVLSTYHTPDTQNGFLVSQAVLDASRGNVTDGQLNWMLDSKGISEDNPLYLKGVDIVYNQPARSAQ